MVFFARPSFARVATAQPASSDSDVGFCVRGRLCGGGEDASSLSDAPRPRAALFARLCGGPLMELAAAKTAQALGRLEKASAVEYLSQVKVKPDGRCLFRSLVLGLAANKGLVLSSAQEEREADLLRGAVAEAICPSPERRAGFPDAVMAIKSEMTIDTYCKRVQSPGFWGGESELLVLSMMLRQPICVYLPAPKGKLGFRPFVTYGEKFAKAKSGAQRKVVKLLYSNGNHYDLLL